MKNAKRQIIQLLNRIVIGNVTFMRVLQVTCFVASVGVLAFTACDLMHFELTAVQAVVGVLLSSLTSLVFIGIGLLLPSVAGMEGEQSD